MRPSGQFLEQPHQLGAAIDTQPSIELTLHLFPKRQRLFDALQAGFCEPYLTSAQVAPLSQLHEPLFFENPQVTPERAAIEPHGLGQHRDARLPESLYMA